MYPFGILTPARFVNDVEGYSLANRPDEASGGRASGEMDEVLSHWADGFRLPFRRDICLDEVAGPETRAWTSLYQRIRPKV
jgi:hypothetical protein